MSDSEGKRIGEILVNARAVSPDQMEEVLAQQAEMDPAKRKPIGQILVERKLVTGQELLETVPPEILYSHLAGAKILVAEDTNVMRQLVRAVLEKVGATVDEATDGQDALGHLMSAQDEGNPYSVLLLDLMMPRMDGIETLLRIRCSDELKTTPVVVVTAKSDRSSVIDCARFGVSAYVVKPFSAFQLLEQVEHVLEQNARRRQVADTVAGRFTCEGCDECRIPQIIEGHIKLHPELKDDAAIARMLSDILGACEKAKSEIRSRNY
jgi:two-component system, chemotaxis family, chemotaxis protein CheY